MTNTTFTTEMLDEMITKINKPIGILGSLSGVKVVESTFCLDRKPIRKHIKKSWMRETYHKRIQKKWDKRFGYVETPAVFMIQAPNYSMCRGLNEVSLGGEQILSIHPELTAKVKESMETVNKKIENDLFNSVFS